MRNRYRISFEDAIHAHKWLREKFKDEFFFGVADSTLAIENYKQIERPWESPDALNDWANAWLTPEQWSALKNAIRASRHRRKAGFGKRSIDLDMEAHRILSTVATCHGITMSDAIRRFLAEPYSEAQSRLDAKEKM